MAKPRKIYTLIQHLFVPKETTTSSSYTASPPKGVWRNEEFIEVKNCDFCQQEKVTVNIQPQIFLQVNALMAKYPDDEWLAYLVGSQDENGNFDITGLKIPKQIQSSATVDIDPNEAFVDTAVMGTIHSHHHMSISWSGQDHAEVLFNMPVSILVATKGWECKVRKELPCKGFILSDATLSVKTPVLADVDPILAEAEVKISKRTYEYSKYSSKCHCDCCGEEMERIKTTFTSGLTLCDDKCLKAYKGLSPKDQAEFLSAIRKNLWKPRLSLPEPAKSTPTTTTPKTVVCDCCHGVVNQDLATVRQAGTFCPDCENNWWYYQNSY